MHYTLSVRSIWSVSDLIHSFPHPHITLQGERNKGTVPNPPESKSKFCILITLRNITLILSCYNQNSRTWIQMAKFQMAIYQYIHVINCSSVLYCRLARNILLVLLPYCFSNIISPSQKRKRKKESLLLLPECSHLLNV